MYGLYLVGSSFSRNVSVDMKLFWDVVMAFVNTFVVADIN